MDRSRYICTHIASLSALYGVHCTWSCWVPDPHPSQEQITPGQRWGWNLHLGHIHHSLLNGAQRRPSSSASPKYPFFASFFPREPLTLSSGSLTCSTRYSATIFTKEKKGSLRFEWADSSEIKKGRGGFCKALSHG